VPTEYGFNFPQFYTESPQFYLVIRPPKVFYIAMGKPPGKVPGFKDTLWLAEEFNLDEFFGSKFRAIEIAFCKAYSPDPEFSLDARGQWLLVSI